MSIEKVASVLAEAVGQVYPSPFGDEGGYGEGWRQRARTAIETYWRPIDTAPRDGSAFLGWSAVKPRDDWNYYLLRWYPGRDYPEDCETDGSSCTHWMPLPEPPK